MSSSSPGITIDIQKNSGQGAGSTTYGGTGGQIHLEKSEDPPNSGFRKFKHTSATGAPFQVKEVQHNGKDHRTDLGINTGDKITQLSVWYWSGDDGMERPLLAEVFKGIQYIYKSAKPGGGNLSWRPHPGKQELQTNPLHHKDLETQLDGLNCYLNDAVTLNLTFELSSSLSDKHKKSRDDNTYCCSTHCPQGTSGRVTVKLNKVRCKKSNHRSADCYKHEFTPSNGWKVAAIKYDPTGGSTRNRINLNGHKSPPSVTTVYAFYSGQNPKLIYVDGGTATGWYKKPTSSDKDEQWIPVSSKLQGITPENLDGGTLNCNQWNKLKNALKEAGCGSLPKCPDPPPPPPPLPGPVDNNASQSTTIPSPGPATEGPPEATGTAQDSFVSPGTTPPTVSESQADLAVQPSETQTASTPHSSSTSQQIDAATTQPTPSAIPQDTAKGAQGPAQDSESSSAPTLAASTTTAAVSSLQDSADQPASLQTPTVDSSTSDKTPQGPTTQSETAAFAAEGASGGIIAILTGAATYGGTLTGAGGFTRFTY